MPVRCGRLHGAAPAGTQPVPFHVNLIVFAQLDVPRIKEAAFSVHEEVH